nr:uncharacterized protein LOC111987686 [Quercus suber]
MNEELTQTSTAQEVTVALKQMYPFKAPGPDGMPLIFFQHFWSTCGEVVTTTVLDFLNHDIRVQDLINEATAKWKSTVIDALFLPHEADIMKSISISSRLPPDKLIWTETRNGLFTRACRDALPTKNNLLRRKVIQEELSESCKEAPETVGHVLWSCPKAKEAWDCSKLVITWNEGANQSFQDLLWELLLNRDAGDDQVAQAVSIAWALWHNRNELRYGGVRKSGQQLIRWASDYLREYTSAVAQNAPGVLVPRQAAFWSPPQNGHFKINVDGAVFGHRERWELGLLFGMIKGGLRQLYAKKSQHQWEQLRRRQRHLKLVFFLQKMLGS